MRVWQSTCTLCVWEPYMPASFIAGKPLQRGVLLPQRSTVLPQIPGPSIPTVASTAHCQQPMLARRQAPVPGHSAQVLLGLKVPARADSHCSADKRWRLDLPFCHCCSQGYGVGHRLSAPCCVEAQQLVTSTRNLCMSRHPPVCKCCCNAAAKWHRQLHVSAGHMPALIRYIANSTPRVLARSAAVPPAGCLLMASIPLPTTCRQGPRTRGPVAPLSQTRAWLQLACAMSVLQSISMVEKPTYSLLLGHTSLPRRGPAVGSMGALHASGLGPPPSCWPG